MPGDSILLERGNTFAPSTVGTKMGLIDIPNGKSGTDGHPIVIGVYGTGNRPIIDGSNVPEYHQALRTGSFGYITIQDIEFRGFIYFRPFENMLVGIHHLRFLRNKLEGGFDTSNDTKITFFNPYPVDNISKVPILNVVAPITDIEIGWCEFYNTEGEDAVNIGKAGDNIWVHHNIWKNAHEEALDIGGGYGHIIEYNFISGTTVNGMKFHSQSNPQGNLTVRGNVILCVGSQGTGLAFQNIENSKIYNNTVYSGYAGFFGNRDRVQPESYYGNFEGNEVYNNIFCGIVQIQGSWIDAPIGGQLLYNAPSLYLHRDNKFSHNIYWKYGDYDVIIRYWENGQYPDATAKVNDSRTLSTSDLSKFNSEWRDVAAGEGETMADPMFKNPYWNSPYEYGDFEVQENSPAVNNGLPIPEWTEDILGRQVPDDTAPTIGAYQYGTASVVKPRLSSVSLVDLNTITLGFTKELEKASAENVDNYTISDGISVLSATLSDNLKEVTLSTTEHIRGTTYSVTASNIFDTDGLPLSEMYSSKTYYFDEITTNDPSKLNILEVQQSEADSVDLTTDKDFTIDGDLTTRWAARQMPQFLVFDLGKEKAVSQTRFSFYRWEDRTYNYSVSVSPDNINWTEVLSRVSSKQKQWSEENFSAISGRFIKLVFDSSDNNPGNWANLYEAEIYGEDVVTSETGSGKNILRYNLEQNYPNPFNPATNIRFSLPSASQVNLTVFNIIGQKVKTLINNVISAGEHTVEFNASNLPTGVYIYKITTPQFSEAKKMMLVK